MAQLGFSDLTEDEAFVVCLYRDWHSSGETRPSFEDMIKTALSHDRLFHCIGDVFAVFQDLALDRFAICGVDDLLSPQEEQLLDALALQIGRNRSAFGDVFRPASTIPRSGRDVLQTKIETSHRCVAAGV